MNVKDKKITKNDFNPYTLLHRNTMLIDGNDIRSSTFITSESTNM